MTLKDLRGNISKDSKGVSDFIDSLFKESSRHYIKQHRDWYINERFVRGDHWVVYNKTLNKVQTLPVHDGEVRRTVNKIRSQVRGIKNFIKRSQPRWEVHPTGIEDQDYQEAEQKNKILQSYYDSLNFPLLLTDQIVNSMKYSLGIIEGGMVKKEGKEQICFWVDDTFDVIFDPLANDIQSCRFIIKSFKKPLSSIKEKYGIDKVTADNKESEVEYKEILEQEKYSKGGSASSSDLETAIVKETWLKWEEENSIKVRVITTTTGKVLKVSDKSYRRYPFFGYTAEKNPGSIYGDPWITPLISLNKSLDKTISQVESYIQRMLAGKYLIKQGVEVSSITDKGAEKIYYKGSTPPVQQQLQPLPSAPFTFIANIERYIEELGGIREASLGRTPGSLQSGRALEALQAADAGTVAEPIENLEFELEQIAEFILELIEDYQITTESIIQNGEKVTFIGDKATNKPDDSLSIKASKVNVVIVPEISYSEVAKNERLFQLAEGGLIDPQTLLEKLNISNVGDIVQRMKKNKEEEFKQEMVKQKESHRSSGEGPEDTADLADQENMQMAAGTSVPSTPQALWAPEHTELHMAFIQENRDAYEQHKDLFDEHIRTEEEYQA